MTCKTFTSDAVGAGQFGLRSEAEQGEAGQAEIAL